MGNIEVNSEKKKRSMGMSLWSLWGSKHDEKTMERDAEASAEPDLSIGSAGDGAAARPLQDTKMKAGKRIEVGATSRSRSRRRTVVDQHQTDLEIDENTPASTIAAMKMQREGDMTSNHNTKSSDTPFMTPQILFRAPTIDDEGKRPKADGVAFPFSLKKEAETASMRTLTTSAGVMPLEKDGRTEEAMRAGVGADGHKPDTPVEGATPMDEATKRTDDDGTVRDGCGESKERPPLETFVTANELPS